MIDAATGTVRQDGAAATASLAYLESRVREEVEAALRASSIEATLIHLNLATNYAQRFGQCLGRKTSVSGKSWADEQRIW